MNINLLNSEPALANNKLDKKGVNALTGDDDAFQKILKYSEKEQLSSAQQEKSLKTGTKLANVDGRVLNYKNSIGANLGNALSAKHLPIDDKQLENITALSDDKISHATGKDNVDALLDAKTKSDDNLAELKSRKGSNHSADKLAAKSSFNEKDLKLSSNLKTQKLSTEEPLKELSALKSDPKLGSEKTASIADASTVEENPKLIKSTLASQAKTADSKLEPKLASAEIENDSAATKSKLNMANMANLVLDDESQANAGAEIKLKSAPSATSKSKISAAEHDSKLISKLKAKETEKASTEDSDPKLASTLNAATFTAPVLTHPELTSSNAANAAMTIESDPKLVSASAATLLATTSEKESKITTENLSDESDPKLKTKLDKNNLETTAKAATKKSEPNLTLAANSTPAAAEPISKSTEITNAVLQTIQSEKQNHDINLTTTSTNHAVNQFNIPNQQQVSTPTVTLPVSVNNPQWQDSLSQQIIVFNRQDIQKAEIRLHPEELGSLHIKLEMNDGKMQLQMASAHAAVRGILESAIPHLRTSLAEQGIDLQQADINNSSTSDNANQQSMFSQQRRGSQAEIPLSQQEDLGAIDNGVAKGAIKQSGLSVFA